MSDSTDKLHAGFGYSESTQSGNGLVKIGVEYDECVNYAIQQNSVPVVKLITLTNPTPLPHVDLLVRITAEPEFCAPWESRISSLKANQEYRLKDVDLKLSSTFLAELRERTAGHIQVDVSADGRQLGTTKLRIDLFAYDEWPGIRSIPEMLAAFVMPNHPSVEPILKDASSLLKSWTQDSSLSGYQTRDPKRAWLTVAAIYTALRKPGISYINPPASFETTGQKVRTPDRILETRLGTCLDLSLLCASCIEAAGLNPILVLQDGHAFPGAWLKEETFSPATVDEIQTLRKRTELGEIAFFESTSLTSDGIRDFNQAVSDVAPRLKMDDNFIVAIDAVSARKARIHPLPLRSHGIEPSAEQNQQTDKTTVDSMPEIPTGIAEEEAQAQEPESAVQTRVDQWKRRLLDLSLRNRLLNFKDTKKTIPLMCPDLPGLEDAIAAGTVFTFAPKPPVMSEDDPRSAVVHQQRTGEDAQQEFLKEELASRRLYTGLPENELNKRLLETYRSARTAQEEGGANVCYLALGFLEWTQPDREDRVYAAPLLLLPVELSRKSIQQGFRLQEHDDEPRINVTLLQMLERDFNLNIPGLDPLPRDHSGIDVPAVFQIIRTAVRDIKGWEVKNTVHLGLFSFTKYLMWKDLEDRTEDLMQNSVVEHLIKNPETPLPFDGQMPSPDRIDEELAPSQMFCPRDADSSQLAAVMVASKGNSFVMEGPPGTGKSQTITNMIAQCLAEGKKVLFVAEKMAALSVVHDRLSGVGLAPFCLELHSNKARKADVLRQLGQAASRYSAEVESDWSALGNALSSLRGELNQYAEALHRVYPNGLSAFSATATLVALREEELAPLRWQRVDMHTREDLQCLKRTVEELSTTANACGSVSNNPWVGCCHTEWSPGWAQELEAQIDLLGACLDKLAECLGKTANLLGVTSSGVSVEGLERLDALGALLLRSPGAPKQMLEITDWEDFRRRTSAVCTAGRERDEVRTKLFSEFSPEIATADTASLTRIWRSAGQVWWPISWLRRRKVKVALKRIHKSAKAPVNASVPGILSDAARLQKLQQDINIVSSSVGVVLGRFWREGDADWDEVGALSEWVHSFRQAVFAAANSDAARMSSIYKQLSDTITLANDHLRQGGPIGDEILAFSRALAEFVSARQAVSSMGNIDDTKVWASETSADVITQGKQLVNRWKPAIGALRYWCAWQSARHAAANAGLGPLVAAVESGAIEPAKLQKVYRKSYCQWWLNAVTDQEPLLRQFLRDVHEKKIKRFVETDVEFMKKTRYVVASKLAADRPNVSSATAMGTSELGLLKRELQKKKRHMPVRTLLAKIPNLLPRLKPCLLMSPLSVAQYLEAGQQPFDLVIFDEASQIPVWDAVGAIARGSQVVVAGDPKQLPPTNFFMKAQDDDEVTDESTQVEDLESILDECMGAGLPLMRLNWHYRSRHESLIAFSNYQYYGNSLHTFPSAVTSDNAVSFCHVPNGVYDKGKSRTNREEAKAVVSEVIDRLSTPATSDQTIGIVTFSQAQQTLIEDMLDNERLLHPELESHFSPDTEEPVFVKNLENVQGDERDVILFSICYGRDMNGKLSLNFGPMNRDGGERRLNVAVTRARYAVRVFSSITADEIDLRRTQARGVGDLKLFLEYAQRGPSTLASAVSLDPEADFDSPFEQQVHDALAQRGWQLDLQVGCSGYRIDLGVVDKRLPGRYLAGIECDGANYHSARSARDRDRLRQSVLEGLGWKLIRIWSTDWWLDPKREIARVEEYLNALEQEEPEDASNTRDNEPEQDLAPCLEIQIVSESPAVSAHTVIEPTVASQKHYSVFAGVSKHACQENFYEPTWDKTVREAILSAITHEGPISEGLLIRRIASLWGFTRAGSGIQARVRKLIPVGSVNKTKHNRQVWYWPSKQDLEKYEDFRVPDPESSQSREITDIAPEEIGNASLSILKQHISIDTDELARLTAKIFGYSRLVAKSKTHTDYSIQLLSKRELAKLDGDMIILSS